MIWPGVIAICVPVAFSLMKTFIPTTSHFGQIFSLLMFFSGFWYFIVILVCSWFSLLAFARVQCRKSAGYAILLVVTLCIVFWPSRFVPSLSVGDYIHYWIFRHRYEKAVDAPHDSSTPRFLCFYWNDVSTMAAGETLAFLVFDESDEILLPKLKRSKAWQDRAIRGLAVGSGFEVGPDPASVADMTWHRLFGHYYVVYIDY